MSSKHVIILYAMHSHCQGFYRLPRSIFSATFIIFSFILLVNDETIRKVGSDIQESWMPVATELNLSNRDKQAVFDVR